MIGWWIGVLLGVLLALATSAPRPVRRPRPYVVTITTPPPPAPPEPRVRRGGLGQRRVAAVASWHTRPGVTPPRARRALTGRAIPGAA